MILASVISIAAFFGLFGPAAQAFSAFIALAVAFIASPVIAIVTKGRYYLARPPESDNFGGNRVADLLRLLLRVRDERHDELPFPQGRHLLALLLAGVGLRGRVQAIGAHGDGGGPVLGRAVQKGGAGMDGAVAPSTIR